MEIVFSIFWGLFALFNLLVVIPLTLRDSVRGYRLAGHRYNLKQAVVDLSTPVAYFLWSLFMLLLGTPAERNRMPNGAGSWLLGAALPFMIVASLVQIKRARETIAHAEKRSGIDFNKY